jgi:Phage tail lysozyme
MPIPQNAQAIWAFLLSQGFTPNAAAGILGNIEQESGGNPNEPGGGLIQILGQAGGSLTEQFTAMMNYIKANGSVADINAHASTAQDAALYFSTTYERPNAALANNANREQSAADVLAASRSGNWSTSVGAVDTSTSSGLLGGVFSWAPEITSFFKDADTFTTALGWIVKPGSWMRIGAFLLALILIVGAVLVFTKADEKLASMPMPIPVPL